jgi:multidrug efflux pump subunit AcrA (membrane-fusion protein)
VEQEQAQVDEIQRQLDGTRLEAPFAGVVAQVKAAVGDLADPTVPAVILAAPGEAVIRSELAATDNQRLAPGQAATVAMNDGTQIAGQVASVDDGPGANVRFVRLRVNWDATAPPIGTPAHASVVTERRDQALLVPQRAVRSSGARRYVEVADGSTVKSINVTTGIAADGMVEILDGLADGQLVVVGP